MKRFLAAIVILIACSHASRAGELKDAASQMLLRLNAQLVNYQVSDPFDPDFGAIRCQSCGICHTRAGEAILPLAYEYSLTENEERLHQAIILADWLLSQQAVDGSWPETPDTWTGTTVDQLLMLLLTYPIIEKKLPRLQRSRWLESSVKAADYICGFIDNHQASINYLATASAALSLAWKRFADKKYLIRAGELANIVTVKMNEDHFIEGEGGRERGYRYGVDIGYNLEMSLWGLALYARIVGDQSVAKAVRTSAGSHLPFIYPNGVLDGSMGVRSNKWTAYGSGTSDGFHPLAALLGDPEYIEAAVRNIDFMGSCFTSSGLLGRGPDSDGACDEPVCIYPTFTKAKSMAMTLMWLEEDIETRISIPSDRNSCFIFKSIGTALVRRGPFRATISSYGYKSKLGSRSKNMYRPSGGVMSLLWAEGYGIVQASSQTEYIMWEPLNFPKMGTVRTLSPEIGYTTGDALHYSNLFDFDAPMSVSDDGNIIEISGVLKDRDGNSGGVGYTIDYFWSEDSFIKKYTVCLKNGGVDVSLVEPFVWDESVTVEQTGPHEVLFTKGDVTLSISSNDRDLVLDTEHMSEYRQPYPSMRAIPLVVRISPSVSPMSDTVTLKYQLKAN